MKENENELIVGGECIEFWLEWNWGFFLNSASVTTINFEKKLWKSMKKII